MKFKGNEQGHCPFCGEVGTLDYGSTEFEGDMLYFPWHCLNCKNSGEEWYSMEFIGHNVETENGCVELTDDMIGDEDSARQE